MSLAAWTREGQLAAEVSVVGGRSHPGWVEVSAEALAKVPGENLRVSRADFGALWALAQRLGSQPGPDDPYLIGVLRTCQWLAGQPVGCRS
jgi:hypothetical protein